MKEKRGFMKIGSCHNNPVAFQNDIRRGSEPMVVQVQNNMERLQGRRFPTGLSRREPISLTSL